MQLGDRVSRLEKGKRDVDGTFPTATHGGGRGKSRWSGLHGEGCNGRPRKGDRQRIRPARRDRRGGGPRRGTRARAPGDRPAGEWSRIGRTSHGGSLPPSLRSELGEVVWRKTRPGPFPFSHPGPVPAKA